MAPPFSLQFIDNGPQTPPTTLVTQESNGHLLKSPIGQTLWDTAQSHLSALPSSGRTNATIYIRFTSNTRDHNRTYCTVRVPTQDLKYIYKFWLGIGEWAVSAITGTNGKHLSSIIAQAPLDGFYGRKLIPINLDVLWGLDGLLKHSWHKPHSRCCRSDHYDVYVNIVTTDSSSQNPLETLRRGTGTKRFTHLQVCADAKVEALFQTLIGYERSTSWESISHCLTEVHQPCGAGEEIRLGKKYSFEYVKFKETTMQETEWFKGKSCVALVSSMHYQMNLKTRNAFLFAD